MIPLSWDAMLWHWVSGYRHFEGTSCHLHGLKFHEEINVCEKLEYMYDLDQQSSTKMS
jgi:hypothetical protein